jgi:uncharacterized RDD family membrane protein YckC
VSYVPSPAGFWKRFVAYFIDVLLVSVVLNALMTPVLFYVGLGDLHVGVADLSDPAALASAQDALLGLVPALLWLTVASTLGYVVLAGAYFIGMEASSRQATLGKQALGLKVTARDGGRPTFGQVAGRFVAASLSWLTLNVGHALAGWTRERRALHDFIAGTRVENVEPANAAMPGWGWAIVALNAVAMLGLAVLVAGMLLMAWMALQQF